MRKGGGEREWGGWILGTKRELISGKTGGGGGAGVGKDFGDKTRSDLGRRKKLGGDEGGERDGRVERKVPFLAHECTYPDFSANFRAEDALNFPDSRVRKYHQWWYNVARWHDATASSRHPLVIASLVSNPPPPTPLFNLLPWPFHTLYT